jgi:hypothetical protein
MTHAERIDIIAELELVIATLGRGGIPYTLCGGLAVAVHGYSRATVDIDLVIPRRDLDTVRATLRGCGYIFDNGIIPFPSQGFEFYRLTKIVAGQPLMVALLFTEESSTLWKQQVRLAWKDGINWVLSRQGLLQMKGRSERAKDRIDVEELRRLDADAD